MHDPRRTQQQTGDTFDFGGTLRREMERLVSQGRFGASQEVAAKLTSPGTRHALMATGTAMAFWLGPALLRRKRRRRRSRPVVDDA
jgi:hypothetical protein